MIEILLELLGITMLVACSLLLLLLIYIKHTRWEEKPAGLREKLILTTVIESSPDTRIFLLLPLVLIPIAALFLWESGKFKWHFFVILEISFALLFLIYNEWQKMIRKKCRGAESKLQESHD